MFTPTWITEKEIARQIKNKGYEKQRKNSMKIFSAAVRKWEMLAASNVKNERQWKIKANRNTSSKMFCEQIRLRFLHKPYARVLYVLLFALEKFYHDNHHPQVITPTDNFKYLKRSALLWLNTVIKDKGAVFDRVRVVSATRECDVADHLTTRAAKERTTSP